MAESLKIPVCFAALGASNAIPIQGHLPEEKETILSALNQIIETADENALREYRKNLRHL